MFKGEKFQPYPFNIKRTFLGTPFEDQCIRLARDAKNCHAHGTIVQRTFDQGRKKLRDNQIPQRDLYWLLCSSVFNTFAKHGFTIVIISIIFFFAITYLSTVKRFL